jgi:hypothetical protein
MRLFNLKEGFMTRHTYEAVRAFERPSPKHLEFGVVASRRLNRSRAELNLQAKRWQLS